MKVRQILILTASLLSFMTTIVAFRNGMTLLAPTALLSLASGTCALIAFMGVFLSAGRENASSVPDHNLDSSSGPVHLSAPMSGLLKTLSESPEDIRKIIDYPFINEILSARSTDELTDLVAVAHQRLVKAENALAAVGDRLVTDCLMYLPLVTAVAGAVPKKTEEAAFVVMEKFQVVREAAGRAAASARSMRFELEDTVGVRSVTRTAEESRRAVVDEREAIRELALCTKENREHLAEMSAEIESGLDLLKNIGDITEQSKLIAFNMSIEAARIGEKGLGFKVIIAELHKLNDRTFEFSRKVADLLSRFRDYTAILVKNMETKAGDVVHKVERGMDSAGFAVESLINATDRSQSLTKEIALMSESIDHDLDGVLESLQFQDITRQMIEGALSILGELKCRIDDFVASQDVGVDTTVMAERFAMLKNRLVNMAKTKGEKNALLEVRL